VILEHYLLADLKWQLIPWDLQQTFTGRHKFSKNQKKKLFNFFNPMGKKQSVCQILSFEQFGFEPSACRSSKHFISFHFISFI